jgi:glycosyltransferase involved in cell wall biosynthesis
MSTKVECDSPDTQPTQNLLLHQLKTEPHPFDLIAVQYRKQLHMANLKHNKKTILFCGAFTLPKNGSMGGVLYACRTLLATPIANQYSWILIDSTQPLPPPSLLLRLLNAIGRFLKSTTSLLFRRVDASIVFTPFLTMSLMEKLAIAWLSGFLGRPTAIAFRSEISLHLVKMGLVLPLLKSTLKRSTVVLCQSNEAAVALEELLPQFVGKYQVIPNWIDASEILKFNRTQNTSAVCRITYIGWLEPIKDVATILRGLSLVNATARNWQFAICGSGSERKTLEALVDELGIAEQVTFEGWVDNYKKSEILSQTNLFVMASLSEGLPNSLIEAMAYGIPIAATPVGGIPSVVKDDNGILFPVGDINACATALLQLIQDPDLRTRMGTANSIKIREHHDSQSAMAKIVTLLFGKTHLENTTK